MKRIRRLEETVVNRIAAGEVIQRPNSAIKELIENSLDAGATNISIMVQEGGWKSFTIQDNGHGIAREDLALLCERFATSKLCSIDDLIQIQTFGFRGEALASISHVGRVTVTTKTADISLGWKACYLDGKLVGEPEGVAANVGTMIQVQDLFYNNPVRREQCKSASQKSEEYHRICDVVQRYSIDKAQKCSFSLRKAAANSSPDHISRLNQTRVEVIRSIYGDKLSSALVTCKRDEFIEEGAISNPYYQGKSFIFILFINGRLVESGGRMRGVVGNIYSQILLKGTFPFVYLSLKIPSQNVDVNVHPTKKEVILKDEDLIIDQISSCVKEALSNFSVVEHFSPPTTTSVPTPPSLPHSVIGRVRNVEANKTFPLQNNLVESSTPSSAPPTSPSNIELFNPSSKRYPFQQIHTDPKNRTLDFYTQKRSFDSSQKSALDSTAKSRKQPPSIDETASNPYYVPQPPNETSNIAPSNIKLILNEMRKAVKENAEINEIFKNHSFIGFLTDYQIFIQYGSSLLLVDIKSMLLSWLRTRLLIGIDQQTNNNNYNFATSIQLKDALYSYFSTSTDPAVRGLFASDELSIETIKFYENSPEVPPLLQQLSITITSFTVTQLPDPLFLWNQVSSLSNYPALLGNLLFRFMTETDWDINMTEIDRLTELLKIYCSFYSDLLDHLSSADRSSVIEHSIMNELRTSNIPLADHLIHDGSILKMATTHELYKIFERC